MFLKIKEKRTNNTRIQIRNSVRYGEKKAALMLSQTNPLNNRRIAAAHSTNRIKCPLNPTSESIIRFKNTSQHSKVIIIVIQIWRPASATATTANTST